MSDHAQPISTHITTVSLTDAEKSALREAYQSIMQEICDEKHVGKIPEEKRQEFLSRMSETLKTACPRIYALADDYFHKHPGANTPGLYLKNLPFERDHSWVAMDVSTNPKWEIRCTADLFRLAMEAIDRGNTYVPEDDALPVNNRRVSPDSMKGQFPHTDFKFGYVTFACLKGNKGAQTFVFDIDAAVKSLPEETQQLLQQNLYTLVVPVLEPLLGTNTTRAPVVRKDAQGHFGLVFAGTVGGGVYPYLQALAPNPALKKEDPERYEKAKSAYAQFREAVLTQKQSVTLEDNDFLVLDQRRSLHAGSLHRSLNFSRWVRIAGWGEESEQAQQNQR
jgi:hypothetical protein